MTRRAPQSRRRVLGAALLALLIAAPLSGGGLPVAAGTTAAAKAKPRPIPLRLASVNKTTRLVAPGLAMSRNTRTLMPGASITFYSEPLNRPVTLDGSPWMRLHLSHTVPGDVTLYVRVEAVSATSTVRTLLPSQLLRAPESLLSKGPEADIDLRMPTLRATLAKSERMQIVLTQISGPTDPLHPDIITVYLGALPGEDTDDHDVEQVLHRSKGGSDPARIVVMATGEGPFQPW